MSLHTTVKEKKYTEPVSPIAIDSATEKDGSSLKPEALAALRMKKIWRMHTSKNRTDCKNELLQKQFAVLGASVEVGLKVTVPAGVEGLNKIHIVHLIDSWGQPALFDIHPVLAASRAVYLPRALPAGRPRYQSR